MDERDALLRHFLATLAYRTQKAVREAPPAFGDFRAADGVRTPVELVRHMTGVLDFARSFFTGSRQKPEPLPSLAAEVERFHAVLEEVGGHLAAGTPMNEASRERLLQGPLADAMTHAGQLALLRRLSGAPIPPENFLLAEIDAGRLGPNQAPPASPAQAWPEAPAGWVPPTKRP
jgi:hypothetical protein